MVVREINVEDAHLNTARVEIKSLVVSGKQMTLSVFRQLPDCWWDDVIHPAALDDFTRSPWRSSVVPWGIVRYYWGHFAQPATYRSRSGHTHDAYHVVLQQADTLVRLYVSTLGHVYGRTGWSETSYWHFPTAGVKSVPYLTPVREANWIDLVRGGFDVLPQLFIAV
jgi:hypothetical protein